MPRRGENIRKRKDGRWEGRYYIKEPRTDRNVLHSVYAKTYGEVKEKLFAAKLSVSDVTKEKNTELCFGTVAEEWLMTIYNEKKHSTYIKYRTVYEKHIHDKLDNISFSKLNNEVLTSVFYCEGQEALSISMQKSISCVLNQILSYAVSHYQVKLLQYSKTGCKTGAKPVIVLNQSEQARLMQCLYDEMDLYKMGIIICISTGLRLGEICSLKWKDIDLEGKMMYINTTVQRIAVEGYKTKTILLEGAPKSYFSKREIPLSDELIKLLSSYYNSTDEYVINKCKPMEPRTYQNKFRNYLKSAGVPLKNFHVLRHTFATNCVNNGIDIKSLSEILGHSDVKVTLNRYVHPTIEMKRQHLNSLSDIYGQFLGQQ